MLHSLMLPALFSISHQLTSLFLGQGFSTTRRPLGFRFRPGSYSFINPGWKQESHWSPIHCPFRDASAVSSG